MSDRGVVSVAAAAAAASKESAPLKASFDQGQLALPRLSERCERRKSLLSTRLTKLKSDDPVNGDVTGPLLTLTTAGERNVPLLLADQLSALTLGFKRGAHIGRMHGRRIMQGKCVPI